jgi:hypothetical protein
MSAYLDMLTKFQEQGLKTVSVVQDASIESLKSMREIVEKMPVVPTVPSFDDIPTVPQLVELQTRFLEKMFEQQKAYGKQLATVFTPFVKIV